MPYCHIHRVTFIAGFRATPSAAWLFAVRWPDGFCCPACGHGAVWSLKGKAHTFECAGCGRHSGDGNTRLEACADDVVSGGLVMATHKNGFSARQKREQLGLRSYKSAWLLCTKLRRAMIALEATL